MLHAVMRVLAAFVVMPSMMRTRRTGTGSGCGKVTSRKQIRDEDVLCEQGYFEHAKALSGISAHFDRVTRRTLGSPENGSRRADWR